SVFSAISSGNTVFSDREVEEIENQRFVKSLYHFTPCRYSVFAYIETSGNMPSFSTEMFFESVPDNILDGAGDDWKWHEEDKFIPVIIPRDYLALYNFGFAGSRGLPQISENIVKTVNFKVVIKGKGKNELFTGRIVGFSDYLNTILVPQEFMDWANNGFGETETPRKSKLIVEVKNPADPEIAEFFAATNYDIKENKGEQGKLSYLLKIIITVISVIGLLVLLPAMGLMFLSINLLIYKNRKTLGNLILLGYSRAELAKPYSVLVSVLNASVGLISFLCFITVRGVYLSRLKILNIENTTVDISTIIFVLLFVFGVSFVNISWIRRKIKEIIPPVMG
ncbi:MAG: ABC transporter permease, partial [Prevotellaceae bacterium]|nr:ABC transporter permease [Prevotellaceae bacterium]